MHLIAAIEMHILIFDFDRYGKKVCLNDSFIDCPLF